MRTYHETSHIVTSFPLSPHQILSPGSHRGHQRQPAALSLDKGSRKDYRRREKRAPSVRFDPLAHHYRWRASKIAPKLYGDRQSVEGKFTVDWAQVCQEAAEKYKKDEADMAAAIDGQ